MRGFIPALSLLLYAAVMASFAYWLKVSSTDFVLGMATGALAMAGLLFTVSKTMRELT